MSSIAKSAFQCPWLQRCSSDYSCWSRIFIFAVSGLLLTATTALALGEDHMTEVRVGGQRIQGRPLIKTSDQMYLLATDGQLWHFLRKDIGRTYRANDSFRPMSVDKVKQNLAAEFGSGYDVTAHGRFVVVHPAGQKSTWPNRFDQLYRAFGHYFSARGNRIQNPDFPLVAIVFNDRQSFDQYSIRMGTPVPAQVLGYYSPMTNRIALFDQGATTANRWQDNATTVIHEAAHQTAFNTGIHNRFAAPPRWVTEGLGTMFEARGVYNSFDYPADNERVNQLQLKSFRHLRETKWRDGMFGELVTSDRLFDTDPDAAYALAWALTFYLAEKQSREYVDYLNATGNRQDFTPYPGPNRIHDFTSRFGDNFGLLEQRVLRFMDELP